MKRIPLTAKQADILEDALSRFENSHDDLEAEAADDLELESLENGLGWPKIENYLNESYTLLIDDAEPRLTKWIEDCLAVFVEDDAKLVYIDASHRAAAYQLVNKLRGVKRAPVVRRRETQPTASQMLGNVDFDRLLYDFCKLPLWADTFKRVGMPYLKVRWGNKPRTFVSGHCSYGSRAAGDGKPTSRSSICITLSRYSRPADAAETLLHEVVHAAGYQHHRTSFYRTLRKACEEAFGLAVDNVMQDRIYKYDRLLVERLDALMGLEGRQLPRKGGKRPAPVVKPAVKPAKAPTTLDALAAMIDAL